MITRFDCPEDIRRIIHATNAIESLNSVIRKAINNPRHRGFIPPIAWASVMARQDMSDRGGWNPIGSGRIQRDMMMVESASLFHRGPKPGLMKSPGAWPQFCSSRRYRWRGLWQTGATVYEPRKLGIQVQKRLAFIVNMPSEQGRKLNVDVYNFFLV
ncbi:MAG: hypothetical protein KDJ54_00945 [Candidatus Competibacteraceae bacterium]|nr:hypothetical protein [Candidatus Competibacteraceae bacterium]